MKGHKPLAYCCVSCNESEYLIWRMAGMFQVRTRHDPVMRCGSLIGAAPNAEQAIHLIQAKSRGTTVEIGPWHETVEMAAVPQAPSVPRPRKKRS